MRLGKNVLSQYLRTKCDLALYLLLFKESELTNLGLPEVLSARPGVRELRDAGKELERVVLNTVQDAFQSRCVGERAQDAPHPWASVPLLDLLARIDDHSPWLLLQPEIDLSLGEQTSFLDDLGVDATDKILIPPLTAFVPDLLVIGNFPDASELLPSGERIAAIPGDTRRGIRVVDVKHAQEANPSYESEVVLYSMVLAKWLEVRGLRDRYFVTCDMALWTNGGLNIGAFKKAIDDHVTDASKLLDAVAAELEVVNLPIYVQAIRRFVTETLPAIIRVGHNNWHDLEWHVDSRCASCDWLGYAQWLSPKDQAIVNASPDNYCFLRARNSDHISRLPLMTRGSRRVLETNGIATVQSVATTDGSEPVYSTHTRLRAERRVIPGLAVALTQAETSIDSERTDGMLARYADLSIFISVNFDSGAGLLTGIGLRAFFTQPVPFGQTVPSRQTHRWTKQWIVSAKSGQAEQSVVLAFLQTIASIFEHVDSTAADKGGPYAGHSATQFMFWERRQFDELCAAMGRHLPAVLDPTQPRLLRALAWVFPPEELQPQGGSVKERRPAIAFVKDTVRRLVRTPAIHALTLFNVGEHYHHFEEPVRPPDNFYREPLSDSIPRERIYEIWSLSGGGGGGTRRWGKTIKTLNELMTDFSRTMDTQVLSLASITWKLRADFGDRLRARAAKIKLTIPNWTSGVAQDSKLWIAYSEFQNAVGRIETYLDFVIDAEEIEATHEGMRLLSRIADNGNGEWLYAVSPDSLNTKLKSGDGFLNWSLDARQGFLAQPVIGVFDIENIPAELQDGAYSTIHQLCGIELSHFDRASATAVVRITEAWPPTARPLQAWVIDQLDGEMSQGMTLRPALPPDIQLRRIKDIFIQVANPPIATPGPGTLRALGNKTIGTVGKSQVTPLARVLWSAAELSALEVRGAGAQDLVQAIGEADELNASQIAAVRHAVTRALSIIWGPPGTGKTKTCASLLHGVICEEADGSANSSTFATLVSANTYKAVGEVLNRLVRSLAGNDGAPCRIYAVYSEHHPERHTLPTLPPHVELVDVISKRDEPAFSQMMSELQGQADRPIVVAAVTAQCGRICEQIGKLDGSDSMLHELFDFVLIDEASQVDVPSSTGPLALMKEKSQLVIVGDHLQMQPISPVPPPVGAEHMVGSILVYLQARFGISSMPLLINYRSHTDIVGYARRLGYPSTLSAHFAATALEFHGDVLSVDAHFNAAGLPPSDAWASILSREHPIVAVTYPDGMSGQANEFEAECVAATVWLLRETCRPNLAQNAPTAMPEPWTAADFWNRGVGIVTPHRAQRAQIVRRLQQLFDPSEAELIEEAVDTVERFQGGERHTIIVSFGVGDPDVISGEEAFLMQLERTNVAISRAMAKCIVFISDELANHIPEDRVAAKSAHALHGVVDEWCNTKSDHVVHCPSGDRAVTVRWRLTP